MNTRLASVITPPGWVQAADEGRSGLGTLLTIRRHDIAANCVRSVAWFVKLLSCLGFWVAIAGAHENTVAVPTDWWRAWDLDPSTVVVVFVFGALYAAGLHSLRAATSRPEKFRREAWFFAAGWVVLVVALLSPVHPLSSVLFSVHMTQHELLMVVAAPLMILGRPAVACLWALPADISRPALARLRGAGMGLVWRWSTKAIVASFVHAVALWIWHAPILFEATLASNAVHALQHATFLGSAMVFWQAVLFGERRAADYGLAVLYLFFTAMHSGALGALITFAANPWYPSYTATAGAWGITPLEDQQLGGLIMWIPAGMIYVLAGLLLFAAWLRESDRRAIHRETPEGGQTCAPAS
jgi:putative membrane protein